MPTRTAPIVPEAIATMLANTATRAHHTATWDRAIELAAAIIGPRTAGLSIPQHITHVLDAARQIHTLLTDGAPTLTTVDVSATDTTPPAPARRRSTPKTVATTEAPYTATQAPARRTRRTRTTTTD